MRRVYEVSFTVELASGWADSPCGHFKIAYVPDNVLSIRVPKYSDIKELIQTGYWRHKHSGAVHKYSSRTNDPTLHELITDKPDEWERVEVRPV